jgi:deoxyribonuclease V
MHYTMLAMENKEPLVQRRHRWDVSLKRARAIQGELRNHWIGEDRFSRIQTVAGLDAAFVLVESQAVKSKLPQKKSSTWNILREANRAIGCVVMYRYPDLQEIDRAFAILPLRFPYVPGFLSFREIPVLLAALVKLKSMPDLLFCDGQGYAHPRRLGLATHLGIVLDRPAIGCAKSLLVGTHGKLGVKAGSWSPLVDSKTGGERIGAALRTRESVRPIYVSQGNLVSLPTAIRLTLSVSSGFRLPRPTRDADRFASETKEKLLKGLLSEK